MDACAGVRLRSRLRACRVEWPGLCGEDASHGVCRKGFGIPAFSVRALEVLDFGT